MTSLVKKSNHKGKPAFNGNQKISENKQVALLVILQMNDWDLQINKKDAENNFIDTGDQWFVLSHKEPSAPKPEDG